MPLPPPPPPSFVIKRTGILSLPALKRFSTLFCGHITVYAAAIGVVLIDAVGVPDGLIVAVRVAVGLMEELGDCVGVGVGEVA